MSDTLPTNEDTSRDVGLTVRATYTATGEEEAFALSSEHIYDTFESMLAEWPPDMLLNTVIIQDHDIDPVNIQNIVSAYDGSVPVQNGSDSLVVVTRDTDDDSTTTGTGTTTGGDGDDTSDGDTDTTSVDRPHRTPSQVLEDNASLYREKNADYGNSWRLVGETVALWADELGVDSVDVSDADNAAALGLYWERLIKLVRAFNLEFSDQTPHNEATTESHADASTYAAMQAALEESRDD